MTRVHGPSVAKLPRPFVIAHRGGGLIAPEHTQAAYDLAVSLGVDAIEAGDLHLLTDGGVGVMHDATVDRTTSGTGSVAAFSAIGWNQLTQDAASWFRGGWPDQGPPLTWGEILTRYGGTSVLVPEIKDERLATAAVVCAGIHAAGLVDSVLVQCFDFTVAAAVAEAGCHALYLMTTAREHTPSELLAAGIRWASLPARLDPSSAAAFADAGVAVVVWSPDLQKTVDAWQATGNVSGYFTNQPLYAPGALNGYRYRVTSAPWVVDGRRSHGLVDFHGLGDDTLLDVVGTHGAYRLRPAATHRSAVLMGCFCPVVDAATSYTITVPFMVDTLDTDPTSFVGCYFGMSDDTTGPDNDHIKGATGWLSTLRQDGELRLYRGDGRAWSMQGSMQGPALSEGAVAAFVTTVTPTWVSIARNDNAAAVPCADLTNGSTSRGLRVHDVTNRGGYFHLRSATHDGVGMFSWANVTVT